MSTELQLQASAPVAQDVSQNLTLIAHNPEEMRVAQAGLSQWFAAKIEICRKDSADLEESLSIATTHNIPTAALQRQANAMAARVRFYRKCKEAVDAGYCIVPNFPVDVFAIRTNRKKPDEQITTDWRTDRTQHAPGLEIGQGEYKDSSPVVYSDRFEGDRIDQKTGNAIVELHYWSGAFRDEIEWPISINKPEVLGEVANAMALKLFDEIGISPDRKVRKKDPIVVGIIKDPRSTKWDRKHVTFLLAWWINTADL